MKKFLIFLFMFCLLFSGCDKEDPVSNNSNNFNEQFPPSGVLLPSVLKFNSFEEIVTIKQQLNKGDCEQFSLNGAIISRDEALEIFEKFDKIKLACFPNVVRTKYEIDGIYIYPDEEVLRITYFKDYEDFAEINILLDTAMENESNGSYDGQVKICGQDIDIYKRSQNEANFFAYWMQYKTENSIIIIELEDDAACSDLVLTTFEELIAFTLSSDDSVST